jgi:hypothetical protein
MHASVEGAPDELVADEDEKIVIYQSSNREGTTFALSPDTKRSLQARFGNQLHISPRIFVAHQAVHSGDEDLRRIHGALAKQLLALLTGLDNDVVSLIGDFEFRNPVTDERV